MKLTYTQRIIILQAMEMLFKSEYRRLVNKYHPDRQPPEKREEATRKMQEINRIYSSYKRK